jgi:hypothetical protein
MSSSISDLQPDSKAVRLIELIKLKEEKLINYRNAKSMHLQKAHYEYFEVEDELKKLLEDLSIAKLLIIAELPLEKMKPHPSRGPAKNKTFMAIYEYIDPYTNESEMVHITYEDDEDEDDEKEDDEKEDDKKEMTIKENIIQAINL